MNTRRQFLITAPLGALGAAAACRERSRKAAAVTAADDAGRAADVRHGTGVGSAGLAGDVRRSREAGAGDDDAGRARDGGGELAAVDGAAARAAHRAAQGRARRRPSRRPRAGIPRSPAQRRARRAIAFVRSTRRRAARCPANDADIAFAPVTQLSRWIEQKALTSERLTNIYLQRIERFDPKLRCVITLTKDLALAQAKQADAEIAAGQVSRPAARHSVRREGSARHRRHPDDLRRRAVPQPRARPPTPRSSRRLNEAGAVLVAKLSLGALALNDIWFGGQTMNPWLLEEGASGSSAGPGAATAAGARRLLDRQRDRRQHRRPGDALRRHRPASDVRPRAAHRRDDALLVARQARADDAQRRRRDARAAGDHRPGRRATCRACRAISTSTRRRRSTGLRVGYFPAWMKESPATDVDRAALETVRKLGMTPIEVTLPDWPYGSLMPILFAEARGGVRGADAERRPEHAEGAGAGRVAEPVPPGAVPLGGGFRAGRPPAPQGRAGDGAHLLARSTCCSCRRCATRC